jgi:hypothetical protein
MSIRTMIWLGFSNIFVFSVEEIMMTLRTMNLLMELSFARFVLDILEPIIEIFLSDA